MGWALRVRICLRCAIDHRLDDAGDRRCPMPNWSDARTVIEQLLSCSHTITTCIRTALCAIVLRASLFQKPARSCQAFRGNNKVGSVVPVVGSLISGAAKFTLQGGLSVYTQYAFRAIRPRERLGSIGGCQSANPSPEHQDQGRCDVAKRMCTVPLTEIRCSIDDRHREECSDRRIDRADGPL